MVLSKDPTYLKSIELDGEEFRGKQDNGSTVIYPYGRLPSMWFSAPPEDAPEDEGARLITSRGEIFRFGEGDAFEFSKLDHAGVHLRSRFDPLRVSFVIRWHQIAAAHLTGATLPGRPAGNSPPSEE